MSDVRGRELSRAWNRHRRLSRAAVTASVATLVAIGYTRYRAPTSEPVDVGEAVAHVIADSVPPVLVGAGDIASCGSSGDEATAVLLDSIPGIVFTAGDNVYSRGTAAEFARCYAPSWGRHRERTFPAPGNHDYRTSGARDYFAYFGRNAGAPGAGYYRYKLGEWDVFVLNSQISTGRWTAQVRWLRAQLSTTSGRCQIAIMHSPRFSSGPHGGRKRMGAIWDALYEGNVDVVIAGHDHIYERFAPQTPSGAADSARGIRQFVVGTGGRDLYPLARQPARNSEVRSSETFGVLALTLRAESYDWRFVPVPGGHFSDEGTGACH